MASYLVKPGTTSEDLAAQREYAQQLLANASSTKPVGHWTNILAQIAQGGLGGYELGELANEGRRQEGEASDLFGQAIGALAGTGGTAGAVGATAGAAAGGAAAAPMPASPAAASAAAAGRAMPMNMDAIVDGVIGSESGGDPNARNPLSSATGSGQFINSTWLNMTKKHAPNLVAGKSDQEILALRTNPSLSREMTKAYAMENAEALRASGMEVTPGTIKLAHTFGPGGARTILSTGANVPVAQVLPPAVLQANPWIGNKTAGELRMWADRVVAREARRGGDGGGAPAPAAASGGDPGQQQRLSVAAAMYRNPRTRAMGQQILAGEMARERKTPTVVSIDMGNGQKKSMMQMPDGSLRPIDPALMGGGADGATPPNFEDTAKLRKEFAAQTNVKKYDDAIGPYKSMLTSAAKDTPSSDLDMIYGLAKILDPESVVREGEFATVRASQAIPDQIKGYWQFLTEGKGKLTPEARAKVIEVAQSRLGAYRQQALTDAERYSVLAKRYGMDPDLIRKDFPELEQFTPPPAAPGAGAGGAGGASGAPVIRWEDGPDGKPRRVQ